MRFSLNTPTMDISKAFANNEQWIKERLSENEHFFEELAQGQSPSILYIGCSDSRVNVEEVIGAGAGEVFIHRNIANTIPNTDINSKSVIEYAVSHLKVKHIVVCGHYECGGVQAAMDNKDLGILNSWLSNIRDVFRLHHSELKAIKDDRARCDRFVELNVAEQCLNVAKIPEVQKAMQRNELTINGWVFDIKTGKILDFTQDFLKSYERISDKFSEIYIYDDKE